MDILRKININGVDYDISPRASKDQLGMIQLGSGLCITEDDEVSINIGSGIKYSDDNKTLVIDTDWIDNYIFENYGVSKSEGTVTPKPEEDNLSDYFKIISLEDNSNISFSTSTNPYLMYSLNGIDWAQWDYSTVTLSKYDILYLKGNNDGISNFNITGKVELSGNIMSLLYGDNFENNNTLPGTYIFYRLFYNCASIISAKNLVLPATTLTDSCYSEMFSGCTSLTEAPQLLPATTLSSGCYIGMFSDCKSLIKAPELPATTLANYCYSNMFGGCYNLNYIIMLAADISATDCLSNWVKNVAHSGTFVKNSSMTSLPEGDSGIPSGWSVGDYTPEPVTTTPEPITTTPEPITTTPEPITTTPEPKLTQGVEGDIEWNIDTTTGTLILSAVEGSSGRMKNYTKRELTGAGDDGADWMQFGTQFENIVIEPGITNIGNLAFGTGWDNTTNIKSVSIPDTVTSIGEGAFGCTNITSIEIPNSVTTIGSSAFSDCYSLISVTLPNNITSIGSSTFHNCKSLDYIIIPSSVTSIESNAFRDCTGLTSVTIGNSVESIGESAFYWCSGLTSIEIPNSVTSIGSYAFYGCSGLTNVEIPNSVTLIGDYAFAYCSGLTSVTIGNSVTSIEGYNTFNSCTGITEITCLAETPPSLGDSRIFLDIPKSIPLYVPAESVDLYKNTTGWKDFTNIVAIIEDTTAE